MQVAEILKKSNQLYMMKQLEKIDYWQEAKTQDSEGPSSEKEIDQVGEFINEEFTGPEAKLRKSNQKRKIPKN